MKHYCTYFDHRYLPQGLALYQSLCEHAGPFRLSVLALSESCEKQLKEIGFDHLEIIPIKELIRHCPKLRKAKKNRTTIEFYFTCTAPLMRHLLQKKKKGDSLTYIDADCYFFSSPKLIHDMEQKAPIAITPHRFPARIKDREIYGKFNVGWITFRKTKEGWACVKQWEQECLEWCFDRLEGNRFGDQKYLDTWPRRYPGLKILKHDGINCAPWNVENSKIHIHTSDITINRQPLVFYHFHGLKWGSLQKFSANLEEFIKKRPNYLEVIYQKYIGAISTLQQIYLPGYEPTRILRSYEKNKKIRHFLQNLRRSGRRLKINKWIPSLERKHLLEL